MSTHKKSSQKLFEPQPIPQKKTQNNKTNKEQNDMSPNH